MIQNLKKTLNFNDYEIKQGDDLRNIRKAMSKGLVIVALKNMTRFNKFVEDL